MKTKIKLLALSFVATALSATAAFPEIESVKPQEGIYVTYGWHSIVLELKDHRFRYWFSSDVKGGEEMHYPLEGAYTVDGDKIVLEHKKLIPLESTWAFRTVDGVVTMWRSDAMKLLTDKRDELDFYSLGKENFLRIGSGSILVPTKKSAEEAWKSPQFPVPVLTEAEYKALEKKKAEQDGADQPATAPQSKSEDSLKPQSESEPAPR